MQGITFQWHVPKTYHDRLLRDFLREEKQLSRQGLTEIKRSGSLFVNGAPVTVRVLLKEEDEVTVIFPPETRGQGLNSIDLPLHIIYEDEHLLVINKPANLPTIPSIYHPDRSLANAVLFHYDKNNIPYTFHAVNRLDRDTSGLLIVAKHRYAHDLMTKEQKAGKVKRTYIAIVHGQMEELSGVINAPIGRKEESIIEREVRSDGQQAITNFKVIKRLEEETVTELCLETGRTHQIRVHLAYLGHPLLGDDLYGGQLTKIDRQALHSFQLQFFHPLLEKEMNFSIEPPPDMSDIINKKYEDPN
ncbi:RluA family pseudouridine synthase [Anaerobacillus isosaccharinicus]|uniref:Pseudouridine synthase n=1 Tax=Anaerobacillus isosaccharinicus TaxID=1532552 RepID=A0A1S2L9T3_9BACI|nr:RluA family pseudouridine synthase [Anaerobacillus isosaccharinicus]MBA5587638.1 RluA family pseudouridine synthase [Anaerobacillus isosaccharinicus]QOY34188.1 RluA family pseudouridine synthase [Anaerobacillus isosaccharinicus]